MSGTEQGGPRVPSVGGDPRDRADIDEPEGKTWFRDMDEAVIEADRCIQCGTCVTACPSDSIGIDDEEHKPTLVRMCTGCSRCWDFCPRSGMRYERLNEIEANDRPDDVGGTYAVRATDGAITDAGQDGGAVTALLAELLENGVLDGAIVATESDDDPLLGEAAMATTREELLEAAGSSYNQTMQLGHLDDLVGELDVDDPDVALVGTPCVAEGAAALERYDWEGESDPIALTVALLCTRSFAHDRLTSLLREQGVEPSDVERLDVSEGNLFAFDDAGEVLMEESVKDFDAAALGGCSECADFIGTSADISAGNVGSDDDHTTVIVRSERGEAAWEAADDALATSELDETTALDRLESWNQDQAESAILREYDPEGSLSVALAEHREAYADTDRAPQPLNPARVYQYEEWC